MLLGIQSQKGSLPDSFPPTAIPALDRHFYRHVQTAAFVVRALESKMQVA